MEPNSQPPVENIYFVYDEIDSPVVGACPHCGGEVYLAEAAQAANIVEDHAKFPLDIAPGQDWCPACELGVVALPETDD